MKVLRVICIIVGAFLVLDTIVVSTLSNYNLGVILPAILGLPLLLLGVFMHHMDAGFWAFLKWFLLCCYALGAAVGRVATVLSRPPKWLNSQISMMMNHTTAAAEMAERGVIS